MFRSSLQRLAVAATLLGMTAPAAAQRPGAEGQRQPATADSARATRGPDGRPGPGYWQQQVDYSIDATLDPVERRLRGRGTITYYNNSPTPLGELHWHLYQNIFRAGARPGEGGSVVGRSMTLTNGITVTRVAVGGAPVTPVVAGTLMRTPLPRPIAPGSTGTIEVEWTLDVPAQASLRTGSEGEDFGMAQWYPQISAYDDVHGWHDLPYRGVGEFYLEYGNWDVRLTLPRRFVVAATGTLENPDGVLTARQAAALRAAATSPPGELTRVLSEADTGGFGAPGGATRTWRFTADNVRDFAWAASPRFVWNATRTGSLRSRREGVLIHSFFPPADEEFYGESWEVARDAIEFFSQRFGEYAYPQATVVSGPVFGMEYPMLAFQGLELPRVLNMPEQVTVHELGHQWYPMMVGSNETRHAFMDEGFTTFMEVEWFRAHYDRAGYWSRYLPAWARGILGRGDPRRLTYQLALPGFGLGGQADARRPSLMVAPDDVPELELGAIAYQKPAAVLMMLRDVVGDSLFTAAMHEYKTRWQFRHPYPDDFFRTVENVAGRDLGWFWRAWFREARSLDLALGAVRSEWTTSGWRARVDLRNRGEVVMPATLRLTLENGTIRDVRVPETAWAPNDTALMQQVRSLPARVSRAELDPDQVLLDEERENNVWPAGTPPALGRVFGVTWGGLLVLVITAALIAVLVRALGLLDGIRLSGFRPVRFALGPLSLWTAPRGLRVRRIPGPRSFGAGVLAVPPAGTDAARGAANLASAGPVASLLAALVLYAFVFLLQRRYAGGMRPDGNFLLDTTLFLIAGASLIAFLLSLPPRHSRGAFIPNAPWVRLLLTPNSPAMRRWNAIRFLVAQSFAGERPRAWSRDWVEEATALADASAAEAGACLLAYLHALDRGDAPEAGAYLERARNAAARRWWRFRIRRHVGAETAFYATYVEGDEQEGERLFRESGARRAPAPARRRARAAVFIGRGEPDRAAAESRAGLLADDATERWAGEGIAAFERYWLALLLAAADGRVGSAVVTPTPGSLTVLMGEQR